MVSLPAYRRPVTCARPSPRGYHLVQHGGFQLAAEIEAAVQLVHAQADLVGELAHGHHAEPPDHDRTRDHDAEREHEPALDAPEIFGEFAHDARPSRREAKAGEWSKHRPPPLNWSTRKP